MARYKNYPSNITNFMSFDKVISELKTAKKGTKGMGINALVWLDENLMVRDTKQMSGKLKEVV